MKIAFYLSVLTLLISILLTCASRTTTKKVSSRRLLASYKFMNCTFSGITVKKNSVCKLVAFKRSLKSILYELSFAKPLYEAMSSMTVSYIPFTDLEKSNVIINQTIDACQFLNGTLSNPFATWIFDIVYLFISKEYLHQCNYQGNLTVLVTPIQLPPTMSFMRGIYRANLRFFNNDDPNIFSVTCETHLT